MSETQILQRIAADDATCVNALVALIHHQVFHPDENGGVWATSILAALAAQVQGNRLLRAYAVLPSEAPLLTADQLAVVRLLLPRFAATLAQIAAQKAATRTAR